MRCGTNTQKKKHGATGVEGRNNLWFLCYKVETVGGYKSVGA